MNANRGRTYLENSFHKTSLTEFLILYIISLETIVILKATKVSVGLYWLISSHSDIILLL